MSTSQPEARFERVLSVNGRVRLDVSTGAGTVRIAAGGPGVVRIRGILRAHQSFLGLGDSEARIEQMAANPPIEQDGNKVRVREFSDGWFGGRVTTLLDITAPQDCVVRARADSGGIRVEGVQGPVDCSTDSGYVEVANIGDSVRAEADSGRIDIRQVTGAVHAEADSGEIQALEIGGAIEAEADSGEILLSQTVAAPVRAKADSGRIRVKLAAGAGYTVRARADSGHIHIPDLPGGTKNEVVGDIRGGGPSVDLEVDSGDIDVE